MFSPGTCGFLETMSLDPHMDITTGASITVYIIYTYIITYTYIVCHPDEAIEHGSDLKGSVFVCAGTASKLGNVTAQAWAQEPVWDGGPQMNTTSCLQLCVSVVNFLVTTDP